MLDKREKNLDKYAFCHKNASDEQISSRAMMVYNSSSGLNVLRFWLSVISSGDDMCSSESSSISSGGMGACAIVRGFIGRRTSSDDTDVWAKAVFDDGSVRS